MLVRKGMLEGAPQSPPDLGFPIRYTGHLHDDLSLRALYSAADVMTIPSRQDNLPNTGVEAHACGTPVVAFDIGGLPDIVDHQKTGYLAKPFDTEDLARGILWVLGMSSLRGGEADVAIHQNKGSQVDLSAVDQSRDVYAFIDVASQSNQIITV